MEEILETIAQKIKDADAIIIGASNGLSITEGLHLFADNKAFDDLFGDIKQKYGIRCLLQGMMAHWPSEEEKWGFWSRLIQHYCAEYRETTVMSDLKAIIDEKDYFVITSNGECHFEMCGFAPEKIYEVEGNWLTIQCASRCHDMVYPGFELIKQMAEAEQNGKIPVKLVPHCPKCGGNMMVHMDEGNVFIPNIEQQKRLQLFLQKYHNKKLVILELGIGARNQLIKAPLMHLTAQEPYATYVTINLGELYIPDNIREKSFGLDGYLHQWLAALRKMCKK